MREAEFWLATPYITWLYCDAHAENDRQSFRHDLFAAWHAGMYGRIKRLPNLADVLKKMDAKQKGRPNAAELLERIKAANAVFKGKVIRNGVDVTPLRRNVKRKV